MKLRFLIPLAAVIVSTSICASESHLQESFPSEGRRSSFTVSAGFGLAMLDGELGWGLTAGAAQEVSTGLPFYMGLDLGFHLWNRRNQTDPLKTLAEPVEAGTVASLQILPTFYYQFMLPMAPAAIPYLGISIGPSLYFSGGTTASGAELRELAVYPAVLFRPGLHVVVSDDAGVTLEPKMGILKSEFLFVPQVSAIWLL